MSILTRRRALIAQLNLTPSPGVLYDEGYMKSGLNFEQKWTITATDATVSFEEGNFIDESGKTRTAMIMENNDNSASAAAAQSVVETSGILGSELKKYATLNLLCTSTGVAAAVRFMLYSSLSGEWSTNQVAEVSIPRSANIETITINLRSLNLIDSQVYYIGLRLHTGVAQKQYPVIRIIKIWLE